MNNKTVLLLALALCVSSAVAQSGGRVSLELGTVTVWLGMDESVVTRNVKAAGLMVDTDGPHGQVIVTDLTAKRLYTMQFDKNKRLVFASRNWFRDDSHALPSVMDALTSLVDHGGNNCTVDHEPINTPDANLNRIFIHCGERGVILTYGTNEIAGQTYDNDDILETIGR